MIKTNSGRKSEVRNSKGWRKRHILQTKSGRTSGRRAESRNQGYEYEHEHEDDQDSSGRRSLVSLVGRRARFPGLDLDEFFFLLATGSGFVQIILGGSKCQLSAVSSQWSVVSGPRGAQKTKM